MSELGEVWEAGWEAAKAGRERIAELERQLADLGPVIDRLQNEHVLASARAETAERQLAVSQALVGQYAEEKRLLAEDRDYWKKRAVETQAWAERLRAYLSEGAFETIESEQAWKRRAETAERQLAETQEALRDVLQCFADMDTTGFAPVERARRYVP